MTTPLYENGVKICTKCAVEKPLTEFYTHPLTRDRRQSSCKSCCSKYRKADHKACPEKYRARAKAYAAANREKVRAAQALYQRKHKAETTLKRTVTKWSENLVRSARMRSLRDGRVCDIDANFVRSLVERQNGRCYWLGVVLKPSTAARDPQRPSLDRLDSDLGYTKENTVLSCAFANMGRSAASAVRTREFLDSLGLIHTTRPDDAQSERFMFGSL